MIFRISYTIATNGLSFKDSVLLPASDEKTARDAFTAMWKGAVGLKGMYNGEPIIYEVAKSKLKIDKVENAEPEPKRKAAAKR